MGEIVMHAFAIAAAAALIVAAGPAQAQTQAQVQTPEQAQVIDAMITTAMKAAIEEIVPPFERASGHVLRTVYGPSGGLARRFKGGEPADLIIVDSKVLDELINQGKVAPGRTDVARTGIGIAVRKGAPKPDVSSADALKHTLLAAGSIGHTAPAGGGVTAAHITGVFEKLGIAAAVAPKIKFAAGGPDGRVSVLVSSGEAEIGLQQVSELLSNPEVEVIGMLPTELQLTTLYSAGVTTSARQAEAAMSLIRVLTVPTAEPIFKAAGLDPAL
jgi:molybdate transport system substrate-binding protein